MSAGPDIFVYGVMAIGMAEAIGAGAYLTYKSWVEKKENNRNL